MSSKQVYGTRRFLNEGIQTRPTIINHGQDRQRRRPRHRSDFYTLGKTNQYIDEYNVVDLSNKVIRPNPIYGRRRDGMKATLLEEADGSIEKKYDRQFALSRSAPWLNNELRVIGRKYKTKVQLDNLNGVNSVSSKNDENDVEKIIARNPTVYGLQAAMHPENNPISDSMNHTRLFPLLRTERELEKLKNTRLEHDGVSHSIPRNYIAPSFKNTNNPALSQVVNNVNRLAAQTSALKKLQRNIIREQEQGGLMKNKLTATEESEVTEYFTKRKRLAEEQMAYQNEDLQIPKTEKMLQGAAANEPEVDEKEGEYEADNFGFNVDPTNKELHIKPINTKLSPNVSTIKVKQDVTVKKVDDAKINALASLFGFHVHLGRGVKAIDFLEEANRNCQGDKGYESFVVWLLSEESTGSTVCQRNHLTLEGAQGTLMHESINVGENLMDFLRDMTNKDMLKIPARDVPNATFKTFPATFGLYLKQKDDGSSYSGFKFLAGKYNAEMSLYNTGSKLEFRHTYMEDPQHTILTMESIDRSVLLIDMMRECEQQNSATSSVYQKQFEGLRQVEHVYQNVIKGVLGALGYVLGSSKKVKYIRKTVEYLNDNGILHEDKLVDFKESELSLMTTTEFANRVLLNSWYNYGRMPPHTRSRLQAISVNTGLQPTQLFIAFKTSHVFQYIPKVWGVLHTIFAYTFDEESKRYDQNVEKCWKEFSANLTASNLLKKRIDTKEASDFIELCYQKARMYVASDGMAHPKTITPPILIQDEDGKKLTKKENINIKTGKVINQHELKEQNIPNEGGARVVALRDRETLQRPIRYRSDSLPILSKRSAKKKEEK